MWYSLSTGHSTCWCDSLHAKADQSFEWKKRIRFCGFLFLEMAACDWPCELRMQHAFYYIERHTQNVNIKWWTACFVSGFMFSRLSSGRVTTERETMVHSCRQWLSKNNRVSRTRNSWLSVPLSSVNCSIVTNCIVAIYALCPFVHSLNGLRVYVQILDCRANEFVNQFAFCRRISRAIPYRPTSAQEHTIQFHCDAHAMEFFLFCSTFFIVFSIFSLVKQRRHILIIK